MSKGTDIPVLERATFFDGQLLDAADLTSIADYQRSLRWFHNRTLHGWGIVQGLTVSGAKGDREVTVTAGYALDEDGRDLLRPCDAVLQVPPVAVGPGSRFYLTTSYVEDADLPAESRSGSCGSFGAVRRPEEARLRWQSPYDVDPATRYRRGLDVLLAVVDVADCRLVDAPSGSLRRTLPPPCGPHIAAGRTQPGATIWRLYPSLGPVLGVETVVDTSSAGFRRVPAYSATVTGDRRLGSSGAAQNMIIDGAASVEAASTTGFVLRVLLPGELDIPPYRLNPKSALNPSLTAKLRASLDWHVSWTGVEA